MKRILIEWLHCDGKSGFGRLHAEIEAVIAGAVEAMRPFLSTMQIQLDVRRQELTGGESDLPGTIKINGKEATGCAGGKLSVDTLTDAVLKETQRFTEKSAGSPEDLYR